MSTYQFTNGQNVKMLDLEGNLLDGVVAEDVAIGEGLAKVYYFNPSEKRKMLGSWSTHRLAPEVA